MDLSAEAFESISKRLKKHTKQWLKADQHAQLHRNDDPSLMDIYDTTTSKGMYMISIKLIQDSWKWAAPTASEIQQNLISEEAGDPTSNGQTSWIASGIKIQEMQYVHRLTSLYVC